MKFYGMIFNTDHSETKSLSLEIKIIFFKKKIKEIKW